MLNFVGIHRATLNFQIYSHHYLPVNADSTLTLVLQIYLQENPIIKDNLTIHLNHLAITANSRMQLGNI